MPGFYSVTNLIFGHMKWSGDVTSCVMLSTVWMYERDLHSLYWILATQ